MADASNKPVVLVTGAGGMLGSVLMSFLQAQYRVVGTSLTGRQGLACDLSQESAVRELIQKQKPDLVIHGAAYSDVDGCERDPEKAYKANALSCKWLSQFCSSSKIPWIYVSTDYIFDGRKGSLYEADDKTGPVNIYGVTKWLGEFYAQQCTSPTAIVRTSWLFGADNSLNFVNAILKKMRESQTISVLDDQTDCPTSVQDLSQALKRIGELLIDEKTKGTKKFFEIYQVCNAGATTRLEMTREIRSILKLPVTVDRTDRSQIQNRLAIRPAYVAMSAKKYEALAGKPMRPWQDALKEFLMQTP